MTKGWLMASLPQWHEFETLGDMEGDRGRTTCAGSPWGHRVRHDRVTNNKYRLRDEEDTNGKKSQEGHESKN